MWLKGGGPAGHGGRDPQGPRRGQLKRDSNPWDSWAFPVRWTGSSNVRNWVSYQRITSVPLRVVCYLRRADDCKMEAIESVLASHVDAVSGFYQVDDS